MSTILDQFFLFCTYLGNYAFIWFVLAIYLAIRNSKKAASILYIVSASIILSYFTTTILKLFFRIPRPSFQLLTTNYCPADFSFPSGHTATSFAAAYALGSFDPKRKWLYFTLATFISYSRIYLHCHRLIDVVFGVIIGVIVSIVLVYKKNKI